MNKQFWLWLLLSFVCSYTEGLQQARGQDASNSLKTIDLLNTKQSHRHLPDGFDIAGAQEMMAQRLHELHELHQLQERVQEMFKDPKILDSLRKLPPSQLQQLREKLLKGEGLSQNSSVAKLLKQAEGKELDPKQKELLRRFADYAGRNQFSGKHSMPNAPGASLPPPVVDAPDSPAPPPSVPMPPESASSPLDRLQEKTVKWLMENLGTVSEEMLQAMAEREARAGAGQENEDRSFLADLLRSVAQPDLLHSHSGQGNEGFDSPVPRLRAETLSHYLSNLSAFLHRHRGAWDGVNSFFHEASLPSLPHFVSSSKPTRFSSRADGGGWAPGLFALLMLGAIVLFLCRSGLGWKSPLGRAEDAKWRLGPWPVLPASVSTQQDMIRAFEYLALLRLGPAAAVYHHRRLAERLAESSPHVSQSGREESASARRRAAEMLARLYAQARYAPAGEALSQQELSDARHALCFLAGVTAA